jgi:heme/copper-type cytochrome/quinol oxidase subunit 3
MRIFDRQNTMKGHSTDRKIILSPEQILTDHRKRFQARLFYILVVIALLFCSVAFWAISWHERYPNEKLFLPKSLFTALVLLLFCNIPFINRLRQFEADEAGKIVAGLSGVIVLGAIYLFFQLYAVEELIGSGISLTKMHASTVLMTGILLHSALVIPCLVYSFYLWIRSFDAWNDPVKSLLYFSNKYELLRLEYIGYTWHWLSLCILGNYQFLFFTRII